jgi:predicted Holliday junction resolvase-like endonuclease
MTEIAELIDELVSKVVSLETAVTSQNSLVKRLKSEADELQTNIQSLEEDKEILLEDSENSHKRMKELEEELKRVKALNKSVERQDKNLQTNFHEANINLEHLSGRLKNVKLDEDFEKHVDELSTDNLAISNDVKEDHATNISEVVNEDDKSSLKENIDFRTEVTPELTQQDKVESLDVETGEEKDKTNLNQMFGNGSDDREKIMLEEYTSVLKNYNDVTDKLNDTENKNRNSIFELALQVNIITYY